MNCKKCGGIEKNKFLILNTSSADRSMDSTLDIFEELIKREPKKPWKLAWYYGWETFDPVHKNNREMMAWKDKVVKRYEKLRKEGRFEGGYMLSHKEIAEKYLEAGVFLYPTQFYEIHCISSVKAQLAECKMATSDAFALNESVKAKKVHAECYKWGTENTFGDTQIEPYIDLIHNGEIGDKKWAKETYNWSKVVKAWNEILK